MSDSASGTSVNERSHDHFSVKSYLSRSSTHSGWNVNLTVAEMQMRPAKQFHRHYSNAHVTFYGCRPYVAGNYVSDRRENRYRDRNAAKA